MHDLGYRLSVIKPTIELIYTIVQRVARPKD